MRKPSTAFCAVVGSVALCLGIAGFFVSALPAAFFLLLAAMAYMHCSKRFIAWFTKCRFFKGYLGDFINERSMTRCNKIKTLAVSTILVTVAFALSKPLWARILLGVAFVAKYYYFIFCVWTNVEAGHGVDKDEEEDR